jgi:hypothetical protein
MVILSVSQAWNIASQSVHKEGFSPDLDLAQKWQEHVKPIVTQNAPKDIFNLNEIAHFFSKEEPGIKERETLVRERVIKQLPSLNHFTVT